MEKNEIVLFETEDQEIKLDVKLGNETVWLSANQMALLFERDEKTIRKHINNVFGENEVEKDNNTQKMRVVGVKQKVPFYSLDVVISVGYRVKSKRGVEFRRWANSVLKQYMLEGYAINHKRLEALEKTVEIQSKMLSSVLEIDGSEVLQAVNQYTKALTLLDQYDHQSLVRPKGDEPIWLQERHKQNAPWICPWGSFCDWTNSPMKILLTGDIIKKKRATFYGGL